MLKSVADPAPELSLTEPSQCDAECRSVCYRTSRSGKATGWKNVFGYLRPVFCFRQQTTAAYFEAAVFMSSSDIISVTVCDVG